MYSSKGYIFNINIFFTNGKGFQLFIVCSLNAIKLTTVAILFNISKKAGKAMFVRINTKIKIFFECAENWSISYTKLLA